MATLNIFVSFEFDKDDDLKGSFYTQAKRHTLHRIRDFSLREAYETAEWKEKARSAISRCDAVIVLIGEDTHNAPGVRTEVSVARQLEKPILQIRPRKRTSSGVPCLGDPVRRSGSAFRGGWTRYEPRSRQDRTPQAHSRGHRQAWSKLLRHQVDCGSGVRSPRVLQHVFERIVNRLGS